MSKYRFLLDFSEGPGIETDSEKVVFLTDVFSEAFKYRIRDVVERKEIDPQLLDDLEAKSLVEPYTCPRKGEGKFFRKNSVVDGEKIGDEAQISKLLDRGVIVGPGSDPASDDFTMKETTPSKKATKKKTTKKK